MSTPAHILIVEDDPQVSNLLTVGLRRLGYSVTAVESAEHALSLLEHANFDVVFTDIQLPRMQGTELIGALKTRSPGTEVVAMTGFPCLETAMACMRQGAMDFITKPFDLSTMQVLLERALEQRSLKNASTLFHASHAILAARNTPELAEVATAVSLSTMEADGASLYLAGKTARLSLEHFVGGASLLPDALILERVVATRKPEASIQPASSDREGERCVVACPMFIGDRLLGVLAVSRQQTRRPFQRFDLDRLGVLASQLALTLENTHLLQRILLSERLASVGLVAAGVAHEIKQPVSWLRTNLEVLKLGLVRVYNESTEDHFPWDQGPGPALLEELYEPLSDAMEGVRRIGEIVADIHVIGGTRREGRFDAHDAVRSAIRVAGPTLRKANIKLTQSLIGAPQICGAPGRLSQVFINLLVNASQAIQGEERSGEICIRSRIHGDKVLIEVADDGPGIPESVKPHLFDRFFTTKAAEEGTGLGLAICRDIVEELGGTLTVSSVDHCGAVFMVKIPLALNAEPLTQNLMPGDYEDESLPGDLSGEYDIAQVLSAEDVRDEDIVDTHPIQDTLNIDGPQECDQLRTVHGALDGAEDTLPGTSQRSQPFWTRHR